MLELQMWVQKNIESKKMWDDIVSVKTRSRKGENKECE